MFIDFAEAFGCIKHDFIFETLMDFGIPQMFCCLIDLYKFSSFRIICDFRLSKEFYIVRGIKTGDPRILRLHGTKFSGLRSRSRVAFTRQRHFDRDPDLDHDRDRKPEFLPA